jgi:hypothetical protein
VGALSIGPGVVVFMMTSLFPFMMPSAFTTWNDFDILNAQLSRKESNGKKETHHEDGNGHQNPGDGC